MRCETGCIGGSGTALLTGFVLGELVRLMLHAQIKNAVTCWIVKTVPVHHTFDIRTEDIYPAGELLQSVFSHKAVADISG